jgi:predicted membrane-bound spermidine synthase
MARVPGLAVLVLLQAIVSAASLVVEIVAGRLLAPHVGMSLYTWTSVIAVVLAGFSAGHWLGGRFAEKTPEDAMRATGWALVAAALTTAVSVVLLNWIAGPVLAGAGNPLWAIVILTTLVFFLPSFFAGVPAPVLAQIAVTSSADSQQGRALGAMFASGAVGAIAGTLLAGFVFISWLGSALTLAIVTAVYVLSAAACFVYAGRLTSVAGAGAATAAVVAAVLAGSGVAAPGACDRESRYFCLRTIDVSADPENPVRMMVIDHLVHGISARDLPEVMFNEHSAMLDELARRRTGGRQFSSFVIGGGSYSVPRGFAARKTGPITVAEIDPGVTDLAERDFWFDRSTARVLHEDARSALLSRPNERYDVIIGDAFTDIAVPAHLITREFFELVRDRLEPDGSYLMNVVDFEHRLQAVGAIVATLRQVFPVVELWTIQRRPAPRERKIFMVVAGTARSPADTFMARSPDPAQYAAMADSWVDALVDRHGVLLTDDYAPIDRLVGFTDQARVD